MKTYGRLSNTYWLWVSNKLNYVWHNILISSVKSESISVMNYANAWDTLYKRHTTNNIYHNIRHNSLKYFYIKKNKVLILSKVITQPPKMFWRTPASGYENFGGVIRQLAKIFAGENMGMNDVAIPNEKTHMGLSAKNEDIIKSKSTKTLPDLPDWKLSKIKYYRPRYMLQT